MNQWMDRILGFFPVDVAKFWIACDPDDVLLEETVLSKLRERGFELLPFEDPVIFRTEFEERYRSEWDLGRAGPSESLILHFRSIAPNDLPWDFFRLGKTVRLSLANIFPKLSYNVVRLVEPAHFSALFSAHESELHGVRGENESKDFILEHVYQILPRSIRSTTDFWREILRFHFTNRSMPILFAEHIATILKARDLIASQPIALWFTNRSIFLGAVQDAWYRYLSSQGFTGSRFGEPTAFFATNPEAAELEIPFTHPDIRVIIDTLFLDGTLHPLAVGGMPAQVPEWVKAGIIQDPTALQKLVSEGLKNLIASMPTSASSHRDWTDFGRRSAEVLSRSHALDSAQEEMSRDCIDTLHKLSDGHLQAWIAAKHYGDLPSLPVTLGPVMVHHIPRFLSRRRAAGESKIALLVFDGLAMDQWVQIRESLAAKSQTFQFNENACFAWLPTLTSVSRQAIFSGLKPREFEDSIERTDKEESLWKTFWQNEGLQPSEILYRKGLSHVEHLDSVENTLSDTGLKIVGLVIDEVDERLHKERTKKDVGFWIGNWMKTGFVDRLFSIFLDRGYQIYLTADHGNVEAVGLGKPSQGLIAETRGERVRVYRSEGLLADSCNAYPETLRLDIPGLPAQFLPLFAGGRGAFISKGEKAVVHGGVSIEELIVPFVNVTKRKIYE
jgi:hypothetical protein